MKKILLRADDLGYSEGVNYGIEKACRDGLVRSVGIMPNMPATQHGYDLVKDLDLCYGLHTNICTGRPLCDPKLVPSICNEDGTLKASRTYRSAKEDFVVLDEVILEIEAQYEAFVKLTGDKPHYFEGHAVASANFFKGLQIVAERHGCDYLGFDMFAEYTPFRHSKLVVKMESSFPDYDPEGLIKRCALEDYPEDTYPMIVFHPGYLDEFILTTSSLTRPRPKEVAVSCDPALKAWLAEHDTEIITYDDLK